MNERSTWLIGLASANFVVLLAGAWLLDRRLSAVEEKVSGNALAAKVAEPEPVRPTDVTPRPAPPERGREPEKGKEDWKALLDKMAALDEDLYEDYSELKSDLYEIRQRLGKIEGRLRRLVVSVAKPGEPSGTWGLAPLGDPLPASTLDAYRRDAEAFGVKVEPGRVEVRGFLNMSPDRAYPIEYFVTRWPESGHETLIHIVGNRPLDADAGPERFIGLLTALYKGLVAAGFEQGQPSGTLAASGNKKPIWVAPKGDVVHVGVRYRSRGEVHVARANEWVIDPSGPGVLPEECWRFTGGTRTEDMQSGDDMLSVEMSGKAVSVYQDPITLVEIAVASNVENSYQYNFRRIPRPEVCIVLGDPKDGLRLYAKVERKAGFLTALRLERDGNVVPLSSPPVLLVQTAEDQPASETPFSRANGGEWTVTHEALTNRTGFDAKIQIRVDVNGKPSVSTGQEPLWLDLILSKTPIEPKGDGAKPLEPVATDEPVVRGTGQHGGGGPPPPPPPTPVPEEPPPGGMDTK